MKKERAHFMTQAQQRVWEEAEKREGRKIPRTHENCRRVFATITKVPVKMDSGRIIGYETKVTPGPARPGKTAKDRAKKNGQLATDGS